MHVEMERFINSNVRFNLAFLLHSLLPSQSSCTNRILQSRTDAHALTYGDGFSGSHKLKEAICHFLNSRFSPWTALCPSHLAITSGVSNAVECCAWALADFGDYILVGRPYFNAFKTTFGTRPG